MWRPNVRTRSSQRCGGESLAVPLWNRPGANSYPISAFTYVLVFADLKDITGGKPAAEGLVAFLKWCLFDDAAPAMASQMGYAPLPAKVKDRLSGVLGSIKFAGQPLGG